MSNIPHLCPRCFFVMEPGDEVATVVECGTPLHHHFTEIYQRDNEQQEGHQ